MSTEKWLDTFGTDFMSDSTWSRPVFLTRAEMDSLAEKSATWDLSSSIRGEITDWIRNAVVFPLSLDALQTAEVIPAEAVELSVGSPSIVSGLIGPTGVDVYFPYTNTFRLFNLGGYSVARYYNDYRDYEPYTSYEMYLPFYGYISLKAADVLGYRIYTRLKIDWKSGLGLYYVTAEGNDYQRILGTYQVSIGAQVPLGQSGALEAGRNVAMGVVRGAATVASMYVAGSPVGAALAGGTVGGETITKKGVNPETGRLRKVSEQTTTHKTQRIPPRTHYVNEMFDTAANTINNFQFHPNVDRANNILLDTHSPRNVHFIIRRSKFVEQNEVSFNALYGRPLGKVCKLSDIDGYTKISDIRLTNDGFKNATVEELDILKSLMVSGVVLP